MKSCGELRVSSTRQIACDGIVTEIPIEASLFLKVASLQANSGQLTIFAIQVGNAAYVIALNAAQANRAAHHRRRGGAGRPQRPYSHPAAPQLSAHTLSYRRAGMRRRRAASSCRGTFQQPAAS